MKYLPLLILLITTNVLAVTAPSIIIDNGTIRPTSIASGVQGYNIYLNGNYHDTRMVINGAFEPYFDTPAGSYCLVAFDNNSNFSPCSQPVNYLGYDYYTHGQIQNPDGPPSVTTVCVSTTITINGVVQGSPHTVCY